MPDHPAEPALPDEPVPSEAEVAEELEAVADSPLAPDLDERRYPSTIGGAFYLVILAVGTAGIGVVWYGDWRLGVRMLAGALCLAAALRLVLPQRDAGMLAVRNRFFDAIVLGGVGAALFFLVATIPNQST